jgi:hypothetical protein
VSTNFWRKKQMPIPILKIDENHMTFFDEYACELEIWEDNGTLLLNQISKRPITLNDNSVRTIINYLQNWVDTGNFEGTKEAESND